ncbi:Aminoacid dehydrogenase-like protein [Ramaria rubella]|nr:Aminoacid dehydrogenase-like protein [Ramaria rubella]
MVYTTDLGIKKVYHLFGFPIAHSVSPALHNYLFDCLKLSRIYLLTPTTHIGRHMQELCHEENFGGASVTMPLKVSVVRILDHISNEARIIGAVNTIVREYDESGRRLLVGTNTDWLGIRNVLLHYLPTASSVVSRASPQAFGGAGMVIGGGGAARAAVYALASMEWAPIYLVGRDASELAALVTQFPSIPCVPISNPFQAANVKIVVGCVPALPPTTPEEIAADACTRAIFSSSEANLTHSDPVKRIFLDMCYKPRTTPLMTYAASAGWSVVSGIEAMLEQGFAQARMWLAESTDPNQSLDIIPHNIEEEARTMIRDMPDIVVGPRESAPPDELSIEEADHARQKQLNASS